MYWLSRKGLFLVWAALTSKPREPPGNYPCGAARCKTCPILVTLDEFSSHTTGLESRTRLRLEPPVSPPLQSSCYTPVHSCYNSSTLTLLMHCCPFQVSRVVQFCLTSSQCHPPVGNAAQYALNLKSITLAVHHLSNWPCTHMHRHAHKHTQNTQGRSKRSGWSGFGPTNICTRGNHAQEINICYILCCRSLKDRSLLAFLVFV